MNPEDEDSGLDYNEDDYYEPEDDGVTVEEIAFLYGIDLSDYIRDTE